MIVLVIGGALAPADVPALCRRARALLEGGDAYPVLCDLGTVTAPDAVVVDALARMQLIAKRSGRELRIVHAGRELRDLLDVMGLRDAVPLWSRLGVEPRRKPEEREHPRGIQEEADPGDPIAR